MRCPVTGFRQRERVTNDGTASASEHPPVGASAERFRASLVDDPRGRGGRSHCLAALLPAILEPRGRHGRMVLGAHVHLCRALRDPSAVVAEPANRRGGQCFRLLRQTVGSHAGDRCVGTRAVLARGDGERLCPVVAASSRRWDDRCVFRGRLYDHGYPQSAAVGPRNEDGPGGVTRATFT